MTAVATLAQLVGTAPAAAEVTAEQIGPACGAEIMGGNPLCHVFFAASVAPARVFADWAVDAINP